MRVQVNEWTVEKPDDVTLYKAAHQCPGDYDALHYRGCTISTFENGTVVDGIYVGPFHVHSGGDAELIAKTLDEALDWARAA